MSPFIANFNYVISVNWVTLAFWLLVDFYEPGHYWHVVFYFSMKLLGHTSPNMIMIQQQIITHSNHSSPFNGPPIE